MNGFVCPSPIATKDTVLLGHGSGGKLSAELLRDVFLPALANPVLSRLEDQAVIEVGGRREETEMWGPKRIWSKIGLAKLVRFSSSSSLAEPYNHLLPRRRRSDPLY